jgi:polysaccharide biosynthesis protein PslG
MRRRLPKVVVVCVCALPCLASFAGAADASGGAHGDRRAHATRAALAGGINVEGLGESSTAAEAERAVALAVQLHAKLIRAELPWSVLQPNGPGGLNPNALAYTDRLMSDAHAHGIGVIAFVDSTPCWASSAPASVLGACAPSQPSKAFEYAPANPGDFAALAHMLVERYGDAMAAFEVWSEPDQITERTFAGPNKPEKYAALLAAAYPAIKQADPHMTVLAGAFVGINGVFLKLLYKAGIKGHYDALAVHFYTLTLAGLRTTHEAQLANGDATPLWLDEFGWPACWPQRAVDTEQACVTPAIQAQNITNMYRQLAMAGYVSAATLYNLRDSGHDAFGVLASSGAHKPSFSALAHVLASPHGPVSAVRLSLSKSGGRVVATGGGPVGDLMQLEAFQGRVLRFRATFALDRFNRFRLALPAALGTHLRVRVFQQWSGPSRAVQRSS